MFDSWFDDLFMKYYVSFILDVTGLKTSNKYIFCVINAQNSSTKVLGINKMFLVNVQ